MKPWLCMIRDNAAAHACDRIMEGMGTRIITPTSWSPNSPDLNHIKVVWGWMKVQLLNYSNQGGARQRIHKLPRVIVTEVLDSVPAEFPVRILEGLPAKCGGITDASGDPTRY